MKLFWCAEIVLHFIFLLLVAVAVLPFAVIEAMVVKYVSLRKEQAIRNEFNGDAIAYARHAWRRG